MATLDSVSGPVRIAQRGFRLPQFISRNLRILTGAKSEAG